MSLSASESVSAVADLDNQPPIGPFFQDHYGDLDKAAGILSSPFLLELPTKTRERLLAQAAAHWDCPTLTHYAVHELALLEYHLRAYRIALEERFAVSCEQVLWAVKKTVATLQQGEGLDFNGIKGLPLELSRRLLQPFLKPRLQTRPHEQRRPTCASTAWLAALPQQLRTLFYATPQSVEESMRIDLAKTLRSVPMRLLLNLLPNGTHYPAVYYQWPAPTGEIGWHMITGVVCWHDELIIVDTDCNVECELALTQNFERYLDLLQRVMSEPAPCAHFRRYLDSASEVWLYRHNGAGQYEKWACLRRAEFQRITHCSVSLDDMLAQMRRSRPFSAPENYPLLSVSLHELMCYRELQDNPGLFVQFLHERVQALSHPHLGWVAELDHIGMHYERISYAAALDDPKTLLEIVRHSKLDRFKRQFLWRLRERLLTVK